jgi:hypothetical protein
MRQPHPFVPLTNIQYNVLTGLMLGDGCLAMGDSNINARLIVGRCVKDRDYLQYEADIFHNFVAPRCHNGVVYTSSIDKRDGSLREGYTFESIASPTFTPINHLWYKNNTKIVPANLELNEQIIAHWLADDGSMDYNKLPYRLRCEISTHGFTKNEVEFLASLLNNRYNEDFLVRPKNRKGKTWYIIKAYDSACRAMFLDIDSYFKMDRKRIWDKSESRFWIDPPERQRSMLKNFKNRKELVAKIVEAGQPITLIQLAHELGYLYGDKVNYTSINKLLGPYINEGRIIKEVDRFNNNTTTIRIIK